MPETTSSAYKTVSWLLAILLVGAVALLVWHGENRKEVLAGKDARIYQSTQLAVEAERKLGQSEETSNRLRAETQKLMDKLEAADQAQKTLEDDMETLQVQHTQSLAAEQEKASRAYAELQGQYDAANEKIATLEAGIARLEQDLAGAAAEQEAQILRIENAAKEKADFYRTALEGSEPERAAQLAALDLQIKESRQTIGQASQEMQAIQTKATDLEEQLAGANRIITEQNQTLSELGQELQTVRTDLAQEQSAHIALQQKHEATVARTKDALTKLQNDFDAARTAHTARMTEAEDKISSLAERLRTETAALAALEQKHDAMVTELRSSLDATEQTLADVKAELSTTREAAAQAKQDHERQIVEAQSTIAGLEQTLEQARQQAAQDLARTRQEGEEAVAYVRGVYTEFSKLGGQHTDQGMLLSLAEDDLRFRTSKADLPDGDLVSLDRVAELLLQHPKLTARIEGHTDDKGREETNLKLSQKRADAVKQALIERGVDPERMTTEGIGEIRPIAKNTSPIGRRQNRRVEIYILEN